MNTVREHIEEIKDALADRILADKLDAAHAIYLESGDIATLDIAIMAALLDYDERMYPSTPT